MSEEVTIKELLDLKETLFKGQSGLEFKEVTLEKIWEPREVGPGKNKDTGKSYHFFPQFMIISDGTGQVGFETAWGETELALSKSCEGSKATITGAKAETYEDKKGKTWRKLKGKLSLLEKDEESAKNVQEEKPEDKEKKPGTIASGYYITVGPNNKVVTNPDILLSRQMLITRTAIAKSFIEQGKHLDMHREEAEEWVKWIYGEGVIIATVKPAEKKELKTKKKDNPGTEKSKGKSKTAKPLSNTVTPPGDEAMGRIGRLYVKAYQNGSFKKGYELADWLNQNWNKKSLLALTEGELKEAEKELTEMVKEKK